MDVDKGREQERKLFRRIWNAFVGNASSRYRSNWLTCALWVFRPTLPYTLGICLSFSTTLSPNSSVLIMVTPLPGLDRSAVE
jgi:hypothetical protein